MLVTSLDYFFFLTLVFLAFWMFRARKSAPPTLICAANLFFYSRWGLTYLVLIPAASLIDYFLGRRIAASTSPNVRRIAVSASIALNLGLIATCRYLPGSGLAGKSLLLPLSLSFYAFQALTYTIDIYRGDGKPSPGFLPYAASVSFFPTTLAGPITRVSSLIPQWNWKGVILTGEEGSRALFLIGLGLAKKFLIADYLGNNLVNRVFDLPTLYSGGDVLVAVYAYAFQLYYDFSGYSDIAIGSALLLGIRLPVNFDSPYRAQNLADFWKRWHISFSRWLRDYLYFSLPFKRTRWMPYLGLIITMALGGIWHGAGWTFLVWGLLHGVGLAVFRLWQSVRRGRSATESMTTATGRFAAGIFTFHYVLLGWIFFRAANMKTAFAILQQIGTLKYSFGNTTPAFLFVLAFAAAAHFVPRNWYNGGILIFARAPALVQAAALGMLALAIRYVAATGATPFIYSKF
jgi:D-alanyl-lipoteichoic acid acyltransferase DltB (MBOAT superfamily)